MISGQTFANCCDTVLDPRYPQRGNISTGKRIFINGDVFEQVLPHIDHRCSLAIHNSDRFFDRIKLEAVATKVDKVYAINCDFTHPKVVNIPLGISDKCDVWKKEGDPNKTIKCYVNFGMYEDTQELKFIPVKYARKACMNYFSKTDFAALKNKLSMDEFTNDLARSKFVVCPMGFGIDTHRFYEAAWLGAVPIVLSSALNDMYAKFGALIVEKWEDVNEELLDGFVPHPINRDVFKTSYWFQGLPVSI